MLDLRDGETTFQIAFSRTEISGAVAKIDAASGWVRAEFTARLEPGERHEWAAALKVLHDQGAGAATLRAREGWLEWTFVMAKRGDLHVSLHLQGGEDRLNELRLFLNLRQDDLPRIVAGLAAD